MKQDDCCKESINVKMAICLVVGKSLLAAGLTTIAVNDKVDLRPHVWHFHTAIDGSRCALEAALLRLILVLFRLNGLLLWCLCV